MSETLMTLSASLLGLIIHIPSEVCYLLTCCCQKRRLENTGHLTSSSSKGLVAMEPGPSQTLETLVLPETTVTSAPPLAPETQADRIVVAFIPHILQDTFGESQATLMAGRKTQKIHINPQLQWYAGDILNRIDKTDEPIKNLSKESASPFPGIKAFQELYGTTGSEMKEIGLVKKVYCHSEIDQCIQEGLKSTDVDMTMLQSQNWIKEIRADIAQS
ncbi:hypothetical protein Forpi1262_v017221 [Fusarium oxysporum f. sp. raphani]|uniref:NmrA-like domain-containing protein n=1 Tax=Fusarium oxysporum f. sp. raphani TaxID=96318 RepID=A0A8J5P1Q5_FUSOX|nr:hypothetical protein Forpi1262_v017221 [Fusarium oxysporum f. sp. raphani]